MQAHENLPSTVGGYRILRRLSREATVDVLLARSEGARGDGQTVVLKLVTPAFRGDAAFDQTFARETQTLAQLDHPCIVRLFDVFSGPDVKAMVLEHVDGVSLGDLRVALSARNETLPDAGAFAIAAALFSALAAAHAARDPQTGNLLPIVHRDVHPGQILIGRDGTVKLTGFGVERITGVRGDARSKEARTYLPPEKARGESVTIRSDVYAGMLVVWELLARRRAIRDEALPEQELIRALSQPSIVSLEVLRPELSALVRSVIARGLETQIERRTVTSEEAASLFRAAASAEEGRMALANAVARVLGNGGRAEEDTVDELSEVVEPEELVDGAPRFSLESSPDYGTPAPPQVSSAPPPPADGRPAPPRPSPRRMWGSSPTLTPNEAFSPTARSASIPDARFSQEPNRVPVTPSPAETSAAGSPLSSTLTSAAPSRGRAFGSRTVAGGFDVSSLKPLIEDTPPSRRRAGPAPSSAPPPAPVGRRDEPFNGVDDDRSAVPAPDEPLPGMGVPLSLAQTMLASAPPDMAAPASVPPLTPSDKGFWSTPPASGDTPATRRYASRKRSMPVLWTGLFFIAAAVGAAGSVAFFRKHSERAAAMQPNAAALTLAKASASPAPSSELTPAPASLPAASATSASPLASASSSAPLAHSAAPEPPSAVPAVALSALPSSGGSAKTSPAPSSVPAPSASAAAAGGTTGTIRFEKKAAGHRVFVDMHVVGEGEGPFTVPCGPHAVKLGGQGRVQKIDVPCGGEITLTK